QPRSRVRRIPNGIDTRAYAKVPRRDALPRVVKQKGEQWLGTLAGLRKVKNLLALVRACAALPDEWQLVIAGEGPEREAIISEAELFRIVPRFHFPACSLDPARAAGLLGVFGLSSHSEQFPISIVEAMAAGLQIAAPRVGDISAMVSSDNGPFLSDPGDEAMLARSIETLAGDPALRQRIGEANRRKAKAEYDEKKMIDRYHALYWGLIGRQ